MDSTQDASNNFRNTERWNSVPVPDYVAERAITKVDIQEDGCWISRYSVASHGYAQIGWSIPGAPGKSAMVLAHRAAWVYRNGQVPLGMTIDHLCKAKRCVNPEHLFLGTAGDNARDAAQKGRTLSGEDNGHSRLTEDSVRAIRSLYATGDYTQRQLARQFHVGRSTVKHILDRRTWRHIQDDPL